MWGEEKASGCTREHLGQIEETCWLKRLSKMGMGCSGRWSNTYPWRCFSTRLGRAKEWLDLKVLAKTAGSPLGNATSCWLVQVRWGITCCDFPEPLEGSEASVHPASQRGSGGTSEAPRWVALLDPQHLHLLLAPADSPPRWKHYRKTCWGWAERTWVKA